MQIADTHGDGHLLARHLRQQLGLPAVDGSNGPGGPGGPGALAGKSPFAWEVTGQLLACLACQAAVYGCAVLLVEAGVLPWAWRAARGALRRLGGGQDSVGYAPLQGEADGEEADDADVAAERRVVQSGALDGPEVPALLKGVSKTYWTASGSGSGGGSAPAGTGGNAAASAGGAVRAVRGLWLSIGQLRGGGGGGGGGIRGGGGGGGECFGLLGVNGAGKSTTFRMLTGECGWVDVGGAGG